MRYDVTCFDGGVRLPGVYYLTRHLWGKRPHMPKRRRWHPPTPSEPLMSQCCTITSAVRWPLAVRASLRAGSWLRIRTARSIFTPSNARHTLWRVGVPTSPPAALLGRVYPCSLS